MSITAPRSSSTSSGTAGSAAWRPTRITPKDASYATKVAFFAWVFSVYDFILFGILLPPIAKDFGWSTAYSTRIATWVSVGTFVVALAVGPLVDRIGRRRGMIVTTAGAAVSSGLTAITPFAAWLVGARTVSGLGYSEQAVNATYLNELYASVEGDTRKSGKGLIYSLVQGGWPIGVLFASLMSSLLLPALGWRGVFAIATFPAVVIALLGRRLKESPKFEVMARGKHLLHEGDRDRALAFAQEHGVDMHEHSDRNPLVQIFARHIRKHTIFLSLAMLFNWFGVQVFAVLTTTVLTKASNVSFSNSLIILILSNAVAYVGYITHGYIGDRVGRRETIAFGWMLSSVAFLLMLLVAHGFVAVITLYTIGLFFLIGPYSAVLFYLGESYPTRIRGTGSSFVNSMGPLGAIGGSAVLTALLSAGRSMNTAASVAGALAILLSGLLILGARRIRPGDPEIDIALAGDFGAQQVQGAPSQAPRTAVS